MLEYFGIEHHGVMYQRCELICNLCLNSSANGSTMCEICTTIFFIKHNFKPLQRNMVDGKLELTQNLQTVNDFLGNDRTNLTGIVTSITHANILDFQIITIRM